MLKIEPIRTSPYHPQTDGLVKRFNSTLKSMLKKIAKDDPTEWDSWLPYLLLHIEKCQTNRLGFLHLNCCLADMFVAHSIFLENRGKRKRKVLKVLYHTCLR